MGGMYILLISVGIWLASLQGADGGDGAGHVGDGAGAEPDQTTWQRGSLHAK